MEASSYGRVLSSPFWVCAQPLHQCARNWKKCAQFANATTSMKKPIPSASKIPYIVRKRSRVSQENDLVRWLSFEDHLDHPLSSLQEHTSTWADLRRSGSFCAFGRRSYPFSSTTVFASLCHPLPFLFHHSTRSLIFYITSPATTKAATFYQCRRRRKPNNQYVDSNCWIQTTSAEEDENSFYFDDRVQSRCLQTKVSFDKGQTTRVCCAVPRASHIICQTFYPASHIAPQCTLNIYQLDKAFKNYEALFANDHARVPCISYNDARDFLAMKADDAKSTNYDKNNSESPCLPKKIGGVYNQ